MKKIIDIFHYKFISPVAFRMYLNRNLQIVNFLDVTFHLNNNSFKSFKNNDIFTEKKRKKERISVQIWRASQ